MFVEYGEGEPLPPIFVKPLYEVPATVIVPEEGADITSVPHAAAKALYALAIDVPVGCANVSLSCPPELKKYLAASPLANVAV